MPVFEKLFYSYTAAAVPCLLCISIDSNTNSGWQAVDTQFWSKNRITSRLVFYGLIAPSVPNAPFGMSLSFDRCMPLRHRFNQNIPPSVLLLQQCHCQNHHRGKLQNLPVSPPSVLFELSRIFLQYTGDTDAKNDGPELWNSNSVIFENFVAIFKKASRGPSAADLDHYGRGQTRSE